MVTSFFLRLILLYFSSFERPGSPCHGKDPLKKYNNTIGHAGLFYHKYTNNPKQILVKQIFGGELERIDKYSNESKIIESNSCNVYGIDKEKFDSIVQFIDNKIVPWTSKLAIEEGIVELITNASPTRVSSLNGKGSNSDFIKYVQLNFPNIKIESELNKK
jgi:hypothetical protein